MKQLTFIFSVFFVMAFADTASSEGSSHQGQQPSCECLEGGSALPFGQKCFPPAFNAPASISLKSCWDMDLYGSFLYWNIGQDGMEPTLIVPTKDGLEGTLVKTEEVYSPGFTIGLGVNLDYDHWTSALEYTWMHSSTKQSSSADGSSKFSSNNWAVAKRYSDHSFEKSSWKMNLDQLDLLLSRPFYQGERLTVAPFGGMRGLWIRQKFNVDLDSNNYKSSSYCWSVGPVVGASANWLLDCGFRFEGKGGGSLLYANYSRILHYERTETESYFTRLKNWGALRPTVNLGSGFGWGSYSMCRKYFIDFSARYDFHVLLDQNMMLMLVNGMDGIPGTNGNLYMHGLTFTARIDF